MDNNVSYYKKDKITLVIKRADIVILYADKNLEIIVHVL